MKKILFLAFFTLASRASAINRVVNCANHETGSTELQILLRAGMASINICPSDFCDENHLSYAQTFVLRENSDASQGLHYTYSSGQKEPIKSTLDIFFQDPQGPFVVRVDGQTTELDCR